MPMPRLPDTHQRNMDTSNAFQVKKKMAAMAPIWNAVMKPAVTQLISFSAAAFRFNRSSSMCGNPCVGVMIPNYQRGTGGDCNSCVIGVVTGVTLKQPGIGAQPKFRRPLLSLRHQPTFPAV